jgi:transposase
MGAARGKKNSLLDGYCFEGFRPQVGKERGIFGKPRAAIIPLARRSKKTHCGECGAVHRGWHQSEPKLIRDLSCGEMQIYLEIEFRHVFCEKCGKVTSEGLEWLAEDALHTKRFANYIAERCRYGAVESVAADLDLDRNTVNRMKKKYTPK